jgi:Protein of unknown function (DUF2934)
MDSPTDAIDRDEEEIRYRAYMIWLVEGQPHGCADEHWHRAAAEVRELVEQRSASAHADERSKADAERKSN